MSFPGEKRETLAFLDVCGRVSSLLLDIARIEGESSGCGMVKIHRPSDEVISNQLGVSGESVTKAFNTLISGGLIVARNNEIFVFLTQRHRGTKKKSASICVNPRLKNSLFAADLRGLSRIRRFHYSKGRFIS